MIDDKDMFQEYSAYLGRFGINDLLTIPSSQYSSISWEEDNGLDVDFGTFRLNEKTATITLNVSDIGQLPALKDFLRQKTKRKVEFRSLFPNVEFDISIRKVGVTEADVVNIECVVLSRYTYSFDAEPIAGASGVLIGEQDCHTLGWRVLGVNAEGSETYKPSVSFVSCGDNINIERTLPKVDYGTLRLKLFKKASSNLKILGAVLDLGYLMGYPTTHVVTTPNGVWKCAYRQSYVMEYYPEIKWIKMNIDFDIL